MSRSLILTFLLLTSTFATLLAQGQQPTPKPPPSTPPGRGNPPIGAPTSPQPRREPRTLYLSGSVQMEDGTSLGEPVMVELRCHGNVRRQVWTSVIGQFSFRLGGRQPGVEAFDASVSGRPFVSGGLENDSVFTAGLGRDPILVNDQTRAVNLSGCEIGVALSGFTSNSIRLGVRSTLDNPDVGVLIVRRRHDVEGSMVSVKTLQAPKKARKAYNKARKEMLKPEPNRRQAAQLLEKSIALFPEFAAAWHLLGQVRYEEKDREGARTAFRRAMESDDHFVRPLMALGEMDLGEEKWDQAAQYFSQAISLNPYLVGAHFNYGLANFYLGQFDLAREAFQTVGESDQVSKYPGIHYALGLVYVRQGEIEPAARELRLHLERFPSGELSDKIRLQLDDWEKSGLLTRPSQSPQ